MNHTSFITREQFVSFAAQLSNIYNPNPDDPEPSGPWGPVVRQAFESSKLSWIMLNPQPLPPREIIAINIAREVISRALLMQEIGNNLNREGEERGIIIVSGFISRFIDDCGNGIVKIKIPHRGIPEPGPDPVITPVELILMGLQFHSEAKTIDNDQVQRLFKEAGEKLISNGINKL